MGLLPYSPTLSVAYDIYWNTAFELGFICNTKEVISRTINHKGDWILAYCHILHHIAILLDYPDGITVNQVSDSVYRK